MQIAVLGIDLGKNSCSVAGQDATGRVVLRKRMRRESVVKLTAELPPCIVAMEACCGAHHLARVMQAQGHQVRLMSPEYVRPYVKAQKNDDRDAEAIAEAATRPTMRFVEVKSEEQLDMQTLHRARDRLVAERTALINQLRGFLLERGIAVPQGRRKLELQLAAMLAEGEVPLSPRVRQLVDDMRAQWAALDRRIAAFDDEFVAHAKTDEAARRLATIPGIGVMNATALVAAIGNGATFARGRDLAAWLGLVPPGDHGRQAASARYQQAWQRLPAQAADPRRAGSNADTRGERDTPGRLAARVTGARAQEHRGRRACGQAGTGGLCRAAQRARL
jgi:transposase